MAAQFCRELRRARLVRGPSLEFSEVNAMAAPAPLSPLAPKKYPVLPPIDGVRFATAAAGVRYAGRRPRRDAGLVRRAGQRRRGLHALQMSLGAGRLVPPESAPGPGARAGRQFGQRQRLHWRHRRARAADVLAAAASKATGAPAEQIFMASTGVIGEPLDPAKIAAVLDELNANAQSDGLMDAAKAIMTTDTFPKVATARASRSARPRSSSTASPRARG